MKCLICNRTLRNTLTLKMLFSFQAYNQPIICQKCLETFQPIERAQSCPGCARSQEKNNMCEDCLKWREQVPESFISHQAFYQYNESLKDWLHTYKIQGDSRFAKIWGERLRSYYREHNKMLVVPIPISKQSYHERGFNQCIELLRCAEIPYIELLENVSQSQKQSKKNRYGRLETDQPFRILKKEIDLNQAVLLFDDLYTTGRTLIYAKQVLYDAGIKEIHSLTIGR